MSRKIYRVGITQGDTNGVGYEVILKTLSVPEMTGICTPVIYGMAKAMSYHRKVLDIQINVHNIHTAKEIVDGRINMINLSEEEVPITLGQATAESGAAALAALERAVSDLRDGLIDVLVTAPVNKANIQCEDIQFTGHTEYLEARLKEETAPAQTVSIDESAPIIGNEEDNGSETEMQGQEEEPAEPMPTGEALMILMNDTMRIALVSTHVPLRQVADTITTTAIVHKLRIFDHSLRRDFSITRPRIAVLSLNPHAGDNGLLGSEEQEIIQPAIAEAGKTGVHAYGPYAADGFFGTRAYEHFDGVLAMYHDQGLAAFKALTMESGVNYTAGLSGVRTSPDHGVAYDIAGKGQADETSLREAIYKAIDIKHNRETWDEAHSNPLRKLYRERKEDERPFGRQPQMRL